MSLLKHALRARHIIQVDRSALSHSAAFSLRYALMFAIISVQEGRGRAGVIGFCQNYELYERGS
jgi:hypothetical protein